MGWTDRVGQLAEAGWDLVSMPVDLTIDLAQAPFTDDEYEGFVGTLAGIYGNAAAEGLTALFGPEGVGGTLIGALPEPVRAGGRTALEGLEWGYREGVSQPVSTVMTMASIADSREGFLGTDWGVWFDKDDWNVAREIAQTRSPGQAVALAFMTEDILDEDEVVRAEGTWQFNMASGTVDALSRIFLSPEVLAGAGVTRVRHVSRLRQRREYFSQGEGFDRFADDVGRLSDDVGGAVDDSMASWDEVQAEAAEARRLIDGDVDSQARLAALNDAGVPAAPGVIDEPRWHGSPRLFDRFAAEGSIFNLFGDGVYTTSDLSVAASYSRARRGGDGVRQGSAYNVVWAGDRPPRIVDIEAPMPDDVREALGWMSGVLDESSLFDDVPLDTLDALKTALDSPGTTYEEFYRGLTNVFAESEVPAMQFADLIWDVKSSLLDTGVDGLRHTGGLRAGGGKKTHEVTIWLDPESVKIDQVGDLSGLLSRQRRASTVDDLARAEEGFKAYETDADALAGRLREKYFPTHGDGDMISHELAAAYLGMRGFAGGNDSLRHAMRFFMGDASVIDDIARESPAAAHRYATIRQETTTIKNVPPPGTPGANARAFNAAQNIPDGMFDDMAGAFDSIDNVVKPTLRLNVGDQVSHSVWYRSHWSMKPVRVLRDMRPQHFVWAGDANSGEHVARFLRESGFSPDEITAFRGEWARTDRFARARDLTPRYQQKAIERVIREYFPNADAALIKQLKADFSESNRAARAILQNARKYDADDNVSRVAWIDPEDGTPYVMDVPLTPSQLEQTVALVDIKKLRTMLERTRLRDPDALSKVKPLRAIQGAKRRTQAQIADQFDNAGQAVGEIMKNWKAAVLLRPAWAMRVVGDEQLRMMAKIGTITRLKELWGNDWPMYVERALARRVLKDGVVDEAAVKKIMAQRTLMTGGVGMAALGPAGALGGLAWSAIRNQRAIRRLRRNVTLRNEARSLGAGGLPAFGRSALDQIGEGPLDILGYQVDRALGDAVEPAIMFEKANSANRMGSFLLETTERRVLQETTEELGQWGVRHVPVGQSKKEVDRFGKDWERIVNDQYGNNDVGRIAFDGTIDDVGKSDRAARLLDWLEDPAGAGPQFKRNNPARFHDDATTIEWADQVVEAADRMLTDPGLRAKLAGGERVYFRDVQRLAKEQGETLDAFVGDIHSQDRINLFNDTFLAKKQALVNDLYDRIGTVTTDNLSRNPYFRHVYETDMRRRIEAFKTSAGDYQITEKSLEAIQNSARRKALQETRDLLYDLAERSEFSDMLGVISPFFNAWQEVLTRWAGLAWENPQWVARASHILRNDFEVGSYFQTVRIGGEEVEQSDGTTKMVGGEKYFQFRLPEFAQDFMGSGLLSKAIDEQGTIRFRADSLNMVTQVIPGVGPIVQLAASKIVDYDPNLEDAFSFILPYGPTRGDTIAGQALEAFQPAWVKRVTAALTENRSYESQAATIMLTRMVEMTEGDRPQIDFDNGDEVAEFLQEVKDDAKNFMYLRAIASAFSPASIGFHSPYQEYIDYYRELKAKNPRTADEEFMNHLIDEGQEGFFALSARFSKSNEGLPATIEAEMTRTKYLDMIRRYPEVGGLIIGIEGGGEARFSAAVYERQFREETSPGSGMTRRERLSLEEILENSRVREGWVEYGKVNDIVYNEMRSRGLPNLRVAEARDLVAVRRAAIAELGEKYPRWYDVYRNPDLTKWEDRIAGLRAIVKDERLSQRDDIRLIGEYLKMRDVLTGELASRSAAGGSGDITSGSNMDVRAVWQAWTDEQMNNPTFSDLLWRWLEFDPLSKVTWPKSQQEK